VLPLLVIATEADSGGPMLTIGPAVVVTATVFVVDATTWNDVIAVDNVLLEASTSSRAM